MKTILILEDSETRILGFQAALAELVEPVKVRIWRDAAVMISEAPAHFEKTVLCSLDHDLLPGSSDAPEPGNGLQVAKFLARQQPFCPVVVHTSDEERAQCMVNELRYAGWLVERVRPGAPAWIRKSWLPRCLSLMRKAGGVAWQRNTTPPA